MAGLYNIIAIGIQSQAYTLNLEDMKRSPTGVKQEREPWKACPRQRAALRQGDPTGCGRKSLNLSRVHLYKLYGGVNLTLPQPRSPCDSPALYHALVKRTRDLH